MSYEFPRRLNRSSWSIPAVAVNTVITVARELRFVFVGTAPGRHAEV